MLAAPRGLSQLAASFIARLRLGIHTHALSSLTIKFTPDTGKSWPLSLPPPAGGDSELVLAMPVHIQLSKISRSPAPHRDLVGLGRVELPTSPLSGVRSSHLSYRPQNSTSVGALVELIGVEPTTS